MEIKLRDTNFCVTGNFKGTSGLKLMREIMAAGGQTSQSLGLKTQVLVCGTGYMPKRETAEQRGLPIIGWPELKILLEGGTVTVEMPGDVEPEQHLTDVVGDVRAALDLADKAAAWEQVVASVDACSPDQVESLVDYIEGHIQQWSPEEQLLCKAPLQWLTAMSQEQDLAAYRLIRSLDFDDIDFNGTQMTKCLKRAGLINVRHLNLAVAKKLTATAFKTLVGTPSFESITHLGLGHFDEKMLAAMAAPETALRHLDTLTTYPDHYWRIPAGLYGTLGDLACMKGVKTVIIACRNSKGSTCIEPIQNLCSRLPELASIELERFNEQDAINYVPDESLRALCKLTGTPW